MKKLDGTDSKLEVSVGCVDGVRMKTKASLGRFVNVGQYGLWHLGCLSHVLYGLSVFSLFDYHLCFLERVKVFPIQKFVPTLLL